MNKKYHMIVVGIALVFLASFFPSLAEARTAKKSAPAHHPVLLVQKKIIKKPAAPAKKPATAPKTKPKKQTAATMKASGYKPLAKPSQLKYWRKHPVLSKKQAAVRDTTESAEEARERAVIEQKIQEQPAAPGPSF